MRHAAICSVLAGFARSGKLPANSTPIELVLSTWRKVASLSMYLSSLRLAPSPWVAIASSGTAQYTVPSVSTRTVTPRRARGANERGEIRRLRECGAGHGAEAKSCCDQAPEHVCET